MIKRKKDVKPAKRRACRKHDSFFKYIYSVPKNASALLRLAQRRTPALRRMLSSVDMETLEPIPGSFSTVGERGESDLAFRAKSLAGGPDAFVGVLLEHKSVRDSEVLAQTYRYVFEVMLNKSRSDFMWLPTKAIIIYNGISRWDPMAEFRKKGLGPFNGKLLPFECVMVNLSDIKDSDCEKAENAVAAVGALVMKHSFDPDGLRSVGDIIKLQLQKLDNAERATIVKKMELYLEMYIDQKLVKELVMAFKSIGQRMGFVSIADAKRKAMASGHRSGLKKGLAEGRAEGRAVGLQEGRAEGAYDKAREMALKMLAKNKPVEEIEEFTGLSKETILAL